MILIGGVIPEDDKPLLMKMGVTEVFTSGTQIDEVVKVIEKNVKI